MWLGSCLLSTGGVALSVLPPAGASPPSGQIPLPADVKPPASDLPVLTQASASPAVRIGEKIVENITSPVGVDRNNFYPKIIVVLRPSVLRLRWCSVR